MTTIDDHAASEGVMIRRAFRSTHPRPARTSRGHGATKAEALKDIGRTLRDRKVTYSDALPTVTEGLRRLLAKAPKPR